MMANFTVLSQRFRHRQPTVPVDLKSPRLQELVSILLLPPHAACPHPRDEFDMSVALSSVLPNFHAGFAGVPCQLPEKQY